MSSLTEGLTLMPAPFEAGLNQWSSDTGIPGSASYDGAANAALVASDPDFGGCLELQKTSSTQKLRWMGETPMLPGLYLRVTARVKAISGALPGVRIAAYAVNGAEAHVAGLVEVGTTVPLTSYGQVVTVSAVIGTGARSGVTMAWGTGVDHGHVGIDLTGANGGVVRIDDISVTEVTGDFLRDLVDAVDVVDYGAKGDGVTDDAAAFVAANAAANGRTVFVPEGTYALGSTVTISNPVRFVGKVTMPADARLQLSRNFDLPSYIDAFGDETLALKKALQALFNYSDHDTLDFMGRRVELTEPLDVQAAVGNQTSFASTRVIRNGQINAIDGAAWTSAVVTAQASYAPGNPRQLSGVQNIGTIPVGARVSGVGVGREVYVTAKNVGSASLTLSQPLYGAGGTQSYTFTRYRYMLDFSGFDALSRFVVAGIEFLCNGVASAVMLARDGDMFQLLDCSVARPKDRVVTSIGTGCQDLVLDRNLFHSNELTLAATERQSIVFNVNANDSKIRHNRAMRFRHFGVLTGNGHMIEGNHWFQGDEVTDGPRVAGLVFANTNLKALIVGNYIDNNFVEWTNEYEPTPDFDDQYSFGGLTITGNIFTANDVAPWFNWLVVKPYGAGHFVQGLTVTGNVFKVLNGSIGRVESVDTTFAGLDMGRMRNVVFDNNTFTAIDQVTASPLYLQFDQATAAATWVVNAGGYMPFGGWMRTVESLVAEGMITTAGGVRVTEMPYVTVEQGVSKQEARVNWSQACKGRVQMRLRCDNPN
ncbi:glycosyl hydrolase family 28-related protein [Frigidibacter sp. MR17.14]|uniref:glycosyl hydrolase family 28-related protein n=1 Tax=Frigidibacter sp. MR17.14 TaxID=3126509 RepID=UPI003012FF05